MTPGPAIRTQTGIASVFLVGGAMPPVVDMLAASDAPVRVRHMASIDDLLHFIEDHDVECAIVDQSRPTESRGLKLALLASSRRVKHLIVLAPPGGRAEIEAIHGVHQVLRTPIAPRQIADAALAYAQSVTAAGPLADKAAPGHPLPPRESITLAPAGAEIRQRLNAALDRCKSALSPAFIAPRRSVWQQFLPLAGMIYKRLAMVILGSLFALFLCYGTIIVFFLTSSGWSLPIELSSGHELVVRAEKDLGEMKVRQNQVNQALEAVQSAIAIAQRDKRDARLRLDIAKKSIELELHQQHKVLEETREHILRLKRIIADFRNENGRGSFAQNLEKAYADRTITKKSLQAGTLAVLESLHRMAIISNELALQQIEESRIDTRVEFLKSLMQQIDQPEMRVLSAAAPDLVYLARDAIADQNVIAQAEQTILNQAAEAAHLKDSLAVVGQNIASLLATPVGRAISAPVTVVFVPYENAGHYEKSQPLYRCTLLVVLCSRVGMTGDTIPGETNAVHPLFGKPLRGTFVEVILDDKNDAKEEILHAGRPLFFF